MTFLHKVLDNAWLLGACRDWPTVRAMKRRGHESTETVLPLHFRALRTPVLCRAGTTDISVAWELFRLQEYQCRHAWDFARVVDCGANVGMFLGFALKQSAGALQKYVAVEPDGESFQTLQQQVDLAGVGPRSTLLNAALWHKEGTVCFDDTGSSWGRHVSESGKAQVRAMSVPAVLDAAGLQHCDLLKLDIEGGERQVLPTISQWADRVDVIVAELHEGLDFAWFESIVTPAGFTAVPAGRLFRGHPTAVRKDRLQALAG